MQFNVVKTVFKRTDFSSFGWIAKVSENLWEVPFYAGINALTKSFRMDEGEKLSYHFHLTNFNFHDWFQGSPPVPAVGGVPSLASIGVGF